MGGKRVWYNLSILLLVYIWSITLDSILLSIYCDAFRSKFPCCAMDNFVTFPILFYYFFFSNVNSVNDAIITPDFFSFLHYYMKYISCDNIMHAWLVPVCICLTNQKKKVSIIFLLKRKKKYLSFIIKNSFVWFRIFVFDSTSGRRRASSFSNGIGFNACENSRNMN